ncbi:MAG: heat-inducible transcriptional repressor HrcA [Candidatus Omnitrophota bacterium]
MHRNIKNKKEQRKYLVLGHVVREYVFSGTPISSKLVAERMGSSVSSATVRNIMAELEECGDIKQPHTSAGRMPTNSGYRRYVNIIQEHRNFEKRKAQILAAEYDRKIRTMQEVLKKTSYLISRELKNTGIVMWPSIENFYLKHLELVKIQTETVLAVLVTMTNAVKNYIIKLDKDIERSQLERIANYVNTNYESLPLTEISTGLEGWAKKEKDEGELSDVALVAQVIVNAVIKENINNEIYWEGLDYLMDESIMDNIGLAKRMFNVFSSGDEVLRLMRNELPEKGLRIYIGEENDSQMFKDCSIVTCGYSLRGRIAGRIGVIGPTRMDYARAMSTVSCLADLISGKLKQINDQE